ncbi:hypothetical protein XM38_048920 [Halomicronema hongdechloris C2206]|uniref:SLH domain-containing protein n=1 Tax=Halomicronema hongdechloris C2206 TaxID=1641165 RepID=A0A1Z3HUC8_9CYAN|nr:iron uptake porin [Halomicronema hongdechloris]ASC73918.1 hypothetical protein XM38_048920 [Halomicronema hongdechloris C2206]
MSKLLWKSLLAAPAALGAVLAISGTSVAAESVEPSFNELSAAEPAQLAQVTSVDELSDVLPSDWAYTALQNLVETYGCIEGYPNRTFRGDRALTRYEFAAGLNACLDVISNLIVGGGVGESDLATIRRLQEEFQAELATLRGRVDALEADVAELEANQFSTTTKLRGQVDSHIVAPFDELEGVEDSTTFTNRVQMNFDTSFTGEDRLRVRLQASGGADPLVAGAGLANADDAIGEEYNVIVEDFYYLFPVGDRLDIIIAANNIVTDDYVVSTIVPFDGPSVADPGGPVFYDFDMGGSAGAGFSFALTNNIAIDAGYSFDEAEGADPLIGISAASEQSYIGQVTFISDGILDLAGTFIRGDSGDGAFTNTFAGLANLDFGRFMVSGYYAYHDLDGTPAVGDDDFTTSWMAGIAIPDLFIEGAQLGAYYAGLPEYTSGENPYMIEGYYSIPVNQFLTITPALIYGDIDSGAADEEAFYGAIRATFEF